MSVEMKDSGIDWIGEIPKHWNIEKPKNMFSLRKTKGNTEAVLLAATQKYGMYPQHLLEGVVKVSTDTDMQSFKTVHKNDYVISLRSFQGGFEMSDYEGVCTPAYQVFYAKNLVNYRYYKFLFKTEDFISKLNSFTIGIREGKNIQYDDFARLTFLPVPSIKEQSLIANFLDKKCAEIDELITLQEQMIAQLTTYKQAAITETVTKGLDPNVKMKDSGVEWIGEIPEHWEIRRIKYIGKAENGLTYGPGDVCDEGKGILVLRSSNIQNGKLSFEDNVYVYDAPKSLQVKKGDIIICSRNGSASLVGKSALVIDDNLYATFGAFMMRFRSEMDSVYTNYLLTAAISQYKQLFSTTTVNQLTIGIFGNLAMPFVNNEKEQQSIANYLDQKCKEIDELISVKKEKIEKLKAYRKSVIYEYVTGKKQVN